MAFPEDVLYRGGFCRQVILMPQGVGSSELEQLGRKFCDKCEYNRDKIPPQEGALQGSCRGLSWAGTAEFLAPKGEEVANWTRITQALCGLGGRLDQIKSLISEHNRRI